MVRGRLRVYFRKGRRGLVSSITQESTPHQIAASFALGSFITMLPTLGTGLLVMFVLAYVFAWINRIAMFASVLVFNPIVKWGVYALSFTLGFRLLGPVEGVSMTEAPPLDAGPDILVRLWLGNTILAVIATIGAYLVAYRVALIYDHREIPVVEGRIEDLVDRLEQHEDDTAAGNGD